MGSKDPPDFQPRIILEERLWYAVQILRVIFVVVFSCWGFICCCRGNAGPMAWTRLVGMEMFEFPLECVIWAHKVGWDWNQEQNCGMEFFTEKNNQVVVLVHSILVGPLDILPVSLKSGLDVLYMMLHLPPPLILIF
jgi:hypothetical protein